MKSITLEVVGGDVESKEVSLDLPATIGRGRDASISLTHPLVSRQHCEILFSQGHVVVRDLDSLNGTFVGSERISESILRPGELLTIGTVTFRAIYDNAVPVTPSPLQPNAANPGSNGMQGTADIANPIHGTFRVPKPVDSEPSSAPKSNSHSFPAESDA